MQKRGSFFLESFLRAPADELGQPAHEESLLEAACIPLSPYTIQGNAQAYTGERTLTSVV